MKLFGRTKSFVYCTLSSKKGFFLNSLHCSDSRPASFTGAKWNVQCKPEISSANKMKSILRKIKKTSTSNESEQKKKSAPSYSVHERLDSSDTGNGKRQENDAEDENYPPSRSGASKKSIIFSATPSKAASKEILNTLKSRASEINSFDQSELDLGTRYSKFIVERFPVFCYFCTTDVIRKIAIQGFLWYFKFRFTATKANRQWNFFQFI